jgi:hypothetical protein
MGLNVSVKAQKIQEYQFKEPYQRIAKIPNKG